MSSRIFCLCFLLCAFWAKADDWDDKMSALLKIAEEHNANKPVKPQPREGSSFYGVEFEGIPNTASVHRLRPEDISVVGALGDSITAANGAGADTLPGVAITYLGMSWSIGGDNTSEEIMTLTNILRHFNPDIKGFSTGVRDKGFNAAVPGARARHIPGQAEDLISRMKNSTEIDYENDWKIVTIFIGGNDLCDLTSETSKPENYIAKLQEGLDVLHNELPRTLVNVVEILEIYYLPQVAHGYGSTPQCRVAQQVGCPYVARADEEQLQIVKEETWKYQAMTEELISSGRYDTRDDFTVVLQPFFHNTQLPLTEDGEVDATYFAPDCFHFSSKGHGMGAINIWNNMLEPVGKKTKEWSIKDLKVPTSEQPYIFTSKNSGDVHTVPSEPCSAYEIPDWLIAVIAVLGASLLIEAMILICIMRKGKPSHTVSSKGATNEGLDKF